jgi:hypothetical protein
MGLALVWDETEVVIGRDKEQFLCSCLANVREFTGDTMETIPDEDEK